jgi:1-acyl-sn-glycerol-3-phosphate acyltransferase
MNGPEFRDISYMLIFEVKLETLLRNKLNALFKINRIVLGNFFVRKVIQIIYIFWALIVFTVFMVLFLPFFLIPPLFGQNAVRVTYFFLRLWSWLFSKLNVIPYRIHGRENIEPGVSYIYVSNHTSFLDIPGLCLAIPGQFRPLAKKELLRIPIFGWIAATAAVIVDRSSHESRKDSLEKLTNILQAGISILIFAEGTQNRTESLLQPLKDGAFRIALDTGRPLLPIVVAGAGKLMPPGKFFIRPGRINIQIGKAIDVTGINSRALPELKTRTAAAMISMLEDLNNK